MSIAALMEKLVQAGAAVRRKGAISLRSEFAGYLVGVAGMRRLLDTTLNDWRGIMVSFYPSLELLSQDEIAVAVLLFEYYLNHSNAPETEN